MRVIVVKLDYCFLVEFFVRTRSSFFPGKCCFGFLGLSDSGRSGGEGSEI